MPALARLVCFGAAAAATVTLAACGGGGNGDGSPQAKQFSSLGCASCHTLAAVDASGRVGPDLDELQPSAATVARQLRNGGSGMPSFKDELSPSELNALARWVARVAGD